MRTKCLPRCRVCMAVGHIVKENSLDSSAHWGVDGWRVENTSRPPTWRAGLSDSLSPETGHRVERGRIEGPCLLSVFKAIHGTIPIDTCYCISHDSLLELNEPCVWSYLFSMNLLVFHTCFCLSASFLLTASPRSPPMALLLIFQHFSQILNFSVEHPRFLRPLESDLLVGSFDCLPLC